MAKKDSEVQRKETDSALVKRVISTVIQEGIKLEGKAESYFKSMAHGFRIGMPAVFYVETARYLINHIKDMGYSI